MLFSTVGAPIPLIMPNAESDTNFSQQSSPEVSMFCRFCTLLETDCLPSSADPGTWKGASSSARFGLDIGGTLCKVVYFEPFSGATPYTTSHRLASTNLGKNIGVLAGTSNTGQIMTSGKCSRLLEECVGQEGGGTQNQSFEKKTIFFLSDENPSLAEKNGSLSDSFATGLESEELNRLAHSTTKRPVLLNGVNNTCSYGINDPGEEGKMDSLASCQCRRSSTYSSDGVHVESETIKARLDKWISEVSGREQEHIGIEHSSNQVSKLWMSSHDPVYLPGRGTLFFKCFETWRMEEFLFLTKEHSLLTGDRALGATGGGARKFGHRFLEIAGLQLQRADEIKSLVRGIDFLVKHAQHEGFEYPIGSYKGGVIQRPLNLPENSSDDGDSDVSGDESPFSSTLTEQPGKIVEDKGDRDKKPRGAKVRRPVFSSENAGCLGVSEALYPYLVVNIGSGVSILRVDSPDQFQRVGGTSLGGSTFFGLAAALTGCSSFEEAIKLATEGDSTQIDMLVGDIYGGDYPEMGLAATTVASSFGKLVQPAKRATATQTPHHLAKAVLLMVTNNIGSLAMLHARATGVDHVMFTGSFLHGNKLAMRLLTVAMEFWSKGQIKAIFLRHEGHAGAVGALLSALDPCDAIDALLLKSHIS